MADRYKLKLSKSQKQLFRAWVDYHEDGTEKYSSGVFKNGKKIND